MLNINVKDAVSVLDYASGLMETMAMRIRSLREAKRYSQEALADLCGVTKSAVSQWEDGTTTDIKLKPFLRLVRALGTDPDYLVLGPERTDPEAPAPLNRRSPR